MRTQLSERRIDYDGSQLRSGWLSQTFGLDVSPGGAVAAFLGACDVKPEFVVDLDEVKSGEPIRAAGMLHFIAEFPELDLEKAVLRQRLLAAVVRDELAAAIKGSGPIVFKKGPDPFIVRRGDDLYDGGFKLSVSIATLSPRSALVHFGLNVDPAGAPVPARGLSGYGADPEDLALAVLDAYERETGSALAATAKVRHVR